MIIDIRPGAMRGGEICVLVCYSAIVVVCRNVIIEIFFAKFSPRRKFEARRCEEPFRLPADRKALFIMPWQPSRVSSRPSVSSKSKRDAPSPGKLFRPITHCHSGAASEL